MNTTQFKFVAVITLALSFTSLASAEMMYKSATRTIYGSGSQLDTEEQTSDLLTTFSSEMMNSGYVRDDSNSIVGSVSAFASQSSTLSENQIRGLSRGSGFGSGGAEGVGRSTMEVEFEIDSSMRFTLTGQLRLAPHGDNIALNGSNAYIRLTGDDGVAMEVMMDEDNLPDSLGSVDFSGVNRMSKVFPAGTYTLEAFAEGHGDDGKTRCVDFDFSFTALEAVAVPEPSSSLLFGMAAFGMMLVRRRR